MKGSTRDWLISVAFASGIAAWAAKRKRKQKRKRNPNQTLEAVGDMVRRHRLARQKGQKK